MDEQYIRNYIKQDRHAKWFKYDEVDIIIGASKFIMHHKETIQKDAEDIVNEIKSILPAYMATVYRLMLFGDGKIRKRYVMRHVEIDLSDSDPEVDRIIKENKEEMKEFLSPEEYDKCYYEDRVVEDGYIPFDMNFRDAIMEYTGRPFVDGEQYTNIIWYKGLKLNECDNCNYRVHDEMQKHYNEDIKGIIKRILCKRGFYYYYKGRKHYKSFSNVDYDEMDIIIELFFDWFLENTVVGKIFYVKDIVEMEGWGDKKLSDIFNETENYVNKCISHRSVSPDFYGMNQIGTFCLSSFHRF